MRSFETHSVDKNSHNFRSVDSPLVLHTGGGVDDSVVDTAGYYEVLAV